MSSLYLDSQLTCCLGVSPWDTFCVVGPNTSSSIFRSGTIIGSTGAIESTKIISLF